MSGGRSDPFSSVSLSPYSAVVVSSVQLFCQSSVGFSEQDELLVQQEDLLLQLLAAAQLQTQGTQTDVIQKQGSPVSSTAIMN